MPVRQVLEFGGLSNSLHRSQISANACYQMQNAYVDRGVIEGNLRYVEIEDFQDTLIQGGCGLKYVQYGVNTKYQLKIAVSAVGNFILVVNNSPTAAISVDATGIEIKEAIVALAAFEPEDVAVTPTGESNAFTIEFLGQYNEQSVTVALSNPPIGVTLTRLLQGGNYRLLLVVVDPNTGSTQNKRATLYVMSLDEDLEWSDAEVVAINLSASDWYFQQYGGAVYGLARRAQIIKYVIGGTVGTTGPPGNNIPKPGRMNPNRVRRTGIPVNAWPSGAVGDFEGFGASAPTASWSNGFIRITPATSLPTGGLLSFTVTFPVDHPVQTRDNWLGETFIAATTTGTPISRFRTDTDWLTLFDDDNATTMPRENWNEVDTGGGNHNFRYGHFTDLGRTNRLTIRKIRIRVTVDRLLTTDTLHVYLYAQLSWPIDTDSLKTKDLPPVVFRPTPDTVFKPRYQVCYYNSTDDVEGPLSDPLSLASGSDIGPQGTHYQLDVGTLSPPVSLSIADKIRIYRKDESGTLRLIPSPLDLVTTDLDNEATEIAYDMYMLHELPRFSAWSGGAGGQELETLAKVADQIGVWRGSLIIGASKKIYCSRIGAPDDFTELVTPDNAVDELEEEDIARPRTLFFSDDRSESSFGIHGRDSLYVASDRNVWVMIGAVPAEADPFRHAPSERGALGCRATCPLGGGILVAAKDGLWYYSVGRGLGTTDAGAMIQRKETEGQNESWNRLIGSDTSAWGRTVVLTHEDELWVFCEDRYMRRTKQSTWLEGLLNHDVEDAVSVPGYGLVFQASDGSVHRVIPGDVGLRSALCFPWEYITKDFVQERQRIVQIQAYAEGSVTLTVSVDDGAAGSTEPPFELVPGQVNELGVNIFPGFKFRFGIVGNTVESKMIQLAIVTEDAGPGRGN